MDDSEGKPPSESVPKWQLNAPEDEPTAEDAPESQQQQQDAPSDKLEVARRFLEDDAVKTAPRHTKVDFLKSKGVEDADIEHLLGGLNEASPAPKDAAAPTDVSKHTHTLAHASFPLTRSLYTNTPTPGVQPKGIPSPRKVICP